jgi:hypothetical protein
MKYIDGKLVAKLDDAVGYFPVRNAVIEVDVLVEQFFC